MKFTPENIQELEKNQVFVYGANASWRHGAGAAKTALKWGAIYGEGPFRGQTYGICTKDENIQTLNLFAIERYINEFLGFTRENLHLEFLVTKFGTGLAGHFIEDIAALFTDKDGNPKNIPNNVILPKEFHDIIYE